MGGLPHFHMAEDILDQYDGVVYQHADSQTDAHQRHVVQRKVHLLHQDKGRNDRGWYRKAADNGGAEILQKEIGNQECEKAAEQNRRPDVRHVLPYILRLVLITSTLTSLGRSLRCSLSITSMTPSVTSTVLVRDCFCTATITLGTLLERA
jgi:hypothetical protein